MNNKHGFTIIEAIFSIITLGIVLTILCIFIKAGLESWLGGEPLVETQEIAREIITGKGNWRGMDGELRELHCILNAQPNIHNSEFYLRKDKIRFIGPVAIVKGSDNVCSTLAKRNSDDIQLIGTGSVKLGTDTISTGADGILQSIPGDLNGDGILTEDERRNSDDFVLGRLMAAGKDGVIINENAPGGTVCYTHKRGDDVQIIPVGSPAGIGAILIDPGENGILESIPGDTDGDGDTDVQNPNNFITSAVISYEFLPGTNTIIRTINGEKPNPRRHLGPETIAKNVSSFTITYYGRDGITPLPYGTVTVDQVSSIALIEIQGTVTTQKKVKVGKGTVTTTFKTKIQPRALNPIYRREDNRGR